jgi:DNA ligase 4
MDNMIHPKNYTFTPNDFLSELEEHGKGLGETRGSMFKRCVARFIPDDISEDSGKKVDLQIAKNRFLFAGGRIVDVDEVQDTTHYVVTSEDLEAVRSLRARLPRRSRKVPRIVGIKWLQDSWDEQTLLDEERYVVHM